MEVFLAAFQATVAVTVGLLGVVAALVLLGALVWALVASVAWAVRQVQARRQARAAERERLFAELDQHTSQSSESFLED